jgi:integrase/recombinase XerD
VRNLSKIEKLNEKHIVEYKKHLKGVLPRLSKETRNYHLIALRNFLKYFARNGNNCLYYNKIKLIKTEKKPINTLGRDELSLLLDAPLELAQDKRVQARDKAILELLICTGLKVSQISILEKKNILLGKSKLKINTKNGISNLGLSNQSVHWLDQYLKLRNDNLPFLFISNDRASSNRVRNKISKALSARSIERIVKKYQSIAGIDKTVTPNSLRHYYAQKLILKGEHLDIIKQKLGSKSDNSINQYINS